MNFHPPSASNPGGGPPPNSKEWWEARYATREWLYGKEPSRFLVENQHLLRKGKLLDLGMGEGRNAVYLASKGFQVEGVDFVDKALQRAQQLARDCGLQVNAQNKDIDMLLLPLMVYDTVLIADYKPSLRFLKDVNRGLVQGGVIVVDAFTSEQVKFTNAGGQGPKVELFETFGPNEVLHNLKNVHVVFYQEREVEPGRHRVQCVARKTGLVG
jgi:cyclopropane fatty-acyl-phospholipid synthase-like methyltransferase